MGPQQTLAEIAAARTDLSTAAVAHCELLSNSMGLLADLAFSDLVLWLPVWNFAGFVAAAQVRPSTAATGIPEDVVGTFVPRGRRPELDRAGGAKGMQAAAARAKPNVPAAAEAIGVGMPGSSLPIAVLARSAPTPQRVTGRLERAYLQAADELFAMVGEGEYPRAADQGSGPGLTRVGDGLIRLDASGIVHFASPNACSAFRRLGVASELSGAHLGSLASRIAARTGRAHAQLAAISAGQKGGLAELESDTAIVALKGIPLRRGGRELGALIMVGDVTELRRRERALISKDVTIREIHHRVKNNLQTVAALLRLQARRLDEPGAAQALIEAERRVAAIAVVHELLAQQLRQDVAFDAIADRLAAMVAQTASLESPPCDIVRHGTFSTVPASMATSLSMVLVELLTNAVAHGADPVVLHATNTGDAVIVSVSDGGLGFPPAFDLHESPRLGLRIVSTLVNGELGGTWEYQRRAARTEIVISVPLASQGSVFQLGLG